MTALNKPLAIAGTLAQVAARQRECGAVFARVFCAGDVDVHAVQALFGCAVIVRETLGQGCVIGEVQRG